MLKSWAEWKDVPPSLPVPGSTEQPEPLSSDWAHISGNHLLKTDFRKPYCPGTALPINQTAEMPLFTTPHSWHRVSITLATPTSSAEHEFHIRDGAVNKQSTPTTPNLQWKHRHTNIKTSISTYLRPHPFCSRCHCHCLWDGSICRSLELECCCYSRDYTGWGWKKDYVRLQQSGGQLLYKEGKFSSN